MVKIHYCPNCAKASREHLFKKVICRVCRTQYETIDVPRSRYYIIQFVFLIMGFVFLAAAFIVTDPFDHVYEFLGVSIIGIAMWIFTLYFQLMDSRDMEMRAEQKASEEKYDTDEPKVISTRRFGTDDEDRGVTVTGGIPGGPKRPIRRIERDPLPGRASRVRRALPRDEPEEGEAPSRKSARPKPPVIKDMAALLREAEDD